jgi:hypothetical protein
MAVDFDTKLSGLAAEILRDAVEGFDRDDIGASLLAASQMSLFTGKGDVTGSFSAVTGSFSAVTGSFPALTGSFPALTGAFAAIGTEADQGVSLKKVFGLGAKLAPVRLLPHAQLAAHARSAPLMGKLEALASWLGRGRLVGSEDELSDADATEAARWIGVPRGYLSYLWEYALTSGWFELDDEPRSDRTWAVLGDIARRWAEGDDEGALRVWSVVFAAVLAQALEIAVSWDPDASRKLRFEGQGVVVAMMLFLARRAGLPLADVRNLVMEGAVGERPSSRTRRAWDGWVRKHGDPARLLVSELTALRAVAVREWDGGAVGLTPLAVWALREQVMRDGVKVPVLSTRMEEMSAASLVMMADGLSEEEFGADSAAWVASRGPDRAARDLLTFAAFGQPQARLVALNLVRGIGLSAHRAWRDAIERPELRAYARIALSLMAAELPASTLPLATEPTPDDLIAVAGDLLALACGQESPDPQEVAEQFRAAIPERAQAWILDLMSRSSHPQVVAVLKALGRRHPDRSFAKEARKAARCAARNMAAAKAADRGDRVPAGAARR